MIKIDFYVGKLIQGELGQSVRREIFKGVFAPLASKEYAILSKLRWIELGSHKSRQDVRVMLKRDEDLDRAVLRERATSLGLDAILAEIEAEG
jgi:hypothetical protein